MKTNPATEFVKYRSVRFASSAQVAQDEVDEKYFLSPEYVEKLLAYNKRQEEHGNGFKAIFHKETDKMCTLTVGGA